MRKRFLIPILAALALPNAIHAEFTNNNLILSKLKEAMNLRREGKISQAEKKCDEIIEISPDLPDGYFCKGSTLGFVSKNKRKSREALKNFTKAIELDPEFYPSYYARGVLQFSMRRKANSKLNFLACSDIKKAFTNNYRPAIEYVKRNESVLRSSKCTGF